MCKGRRKLIFTELKGGIGNQLFIIAAALQQARRLKTKLILIPSFNLRDAHARLLFRKTSLPADVVLAPRISHSPRLADKMKQMHPNVFRESSHDYDPAIWNISNDTWLTGYFQSHKYFPEILPEIVQMVNREAVSRNLPQLKDLAELRLATGLHVRMGDYLAPKNRKLIGVLGNDYYKAALKSRNQEPSMESSIHLFSDSPGMAYARRIHTGLKLESDLDPLLSFIRLSSCGKLILSNSSFSLWAAYFADLNGAEIAAPNKWYFGASKEVKDIFYTKWTRFENTFE